MDIEAKRVALIHGVLPWIPGGISHDGMGGISMGECMTREDIMRMAKEVWSAGYVYIGPDERSLERFAALVAAHEREVCANVCENLAKAVLNGNGIAIENRQLCAKEIRARGEK
jgi:hypothetical protein